ncbi:hypothetical protein H5410_044240 [Solanum commersonii]|uniref:F-box domain-containing protein n=1 Tax=Solanum commersonii TaxID=4109 RepID=A0A9J5X966_SOLCO|nr:hypothetical protein H5410_044240 [Solanum commersonii]
MLSIWIQISTVIIVMGIHFPEEIMMEIINKLLVWSLFRFKCVSKIWKALIVDRHFKMKHDIHTKHDQTSQKILMTQICTHKKDDGSSGSLDKNILLWNPSTRESILLLHPKFPLLYYLNGLGYDATSDDYKILVVNLNAGDGHYIS